MFEACFLSVGAMKAGTTWLHQQLAGHPDIQFCPEKEIHYFADPKGVSYMSAEGRLNRYQQVVRNLRADRLSPRVQQNLAWYARSYLGPQVNDTWYEGLFKTHPPRKANVRYVADFSNLYATLDASGWDHIHGVSKDVRAMYTMRHPSKRLWSHLKFSYEFAGRSAELPHLTDADLKQFLDDASNKAIADYAGTVSRLREFLDQGKAAFHFFEDMRDEPLSSLRSIENFLGISAHKYNLERLNSQVNISQDLNVPKAFAVAAERVRIEQVGKLTDLGLKVPQAWHIPLE